MIRDIVPWIILDGFICGGFCAWLANEKNQAGPLWFLLGLIFGPLALIAAAGMPTKKIRGGRERIKTPNEFGELK